jgi:exopolyphosphatase/guanosine-5'-triphosphate,3'-diphosphate pyrophosphatase
LSSNQDPSSLAVIDVGTHTVLYLFVARGGGSLVVEEEAVAPTRLGEGIGEGKSSPEALARTAGAVAAFVERARARGAGEVKVVGTEALRRGRERADFVAGQARRLGVHLDVLSPEEEGELVLLAARRSLTLGAEPVTVVDVGGGSGQIVRERPGGAPAVASYAVGCVLVTERYLAAEPTAEAWERARRHLREELEGVEPAAGEVVVTGGTAAAAVTLELEMKTWKTACVHGYVLEAEALQALAERVHRLPAARRRALVGMPPGRADIFPAGALALAEVLNKLNAPRATVSAQGVRFGVAYRYFEGSPGGGE